MPPNSYIEQRSAEFKKKADIARPIIVANAALDFPDVRARVNAELQRRGFKSALSDTYIRNERHSARKARGLPFDGLSMPPHDPDSRAARRDAAVEFALRKLRNGEAVTPATLQRNCHVGLNTGEACLAAAKRRFAAEQRGSAPGAPRQTTTPPSRATGAPPRIVQSFRLNGDTKTALSLLTEAMDVEGIITIHVSKGDGGRWGYTCTRRITEDLTGDL